MCIHRLGIAHLQIFGFCMGRSWNWKVNALLLSFNKQTLNYGCAKLLIAVYLTYLTGGIERVRIIADARLLPSRGSLNCQESLTNIIHLGPIHRWEAPGTSTWSSLCKLTAGHTPHCALFGDQERRECVNCTIHTREISLFRKGNYWDLDLKKKKKKKKARCSRCAMTIWHNVNGSGKLLERLCLSNFKSRHMCRVMQRSHIEKENLTIFRSWGYCELSNVCEWWGLEVWGGARFSADCGLE